MLILFAPTRSKGSKIADFVCPDPKGSKISLCVFRRLFVVNMVFTDFVYPGPKGSKISLCVFRRQFVVNTFFSGYADFVCPDPKGSKISLCVFRRLFVRSMVFFLPLGLGKEKKQTSIIFF